MSTPAPNEDEGVWQMKTNQPGLLTIVYVAMLVLGIGIFALEPTWAGLVATLCMVPAVALSFAFPARRKGVRA
jgi:hypothetical protein